MKLLFAVKDQGTRVREIDAAVVSKARGLVAAAEDRLGNKRKKKLEAIWIQIRLVQEIDAKTDDSKLMREIERYEQIVVELGTCVRRKRKNLESLKENPPGMETRQEQIDIFNRMMANLTEECKKVGQFVPWQIQQCGSIDPDNPNAVVSFSVSNFLSCVGKSKIVLIGRQGVGC